MGLPDNIQRFLASYRSLPLEKAEVAKLMHRMDTKHVIRWMIINKSYLFYSPLNRVWGQ